MKYLAIIAALLSLSACYAHHPSSVRVDGVGEVRYHDDHHHHKGKGPHHCPPGHAKKHHC